GLSVRNALAGAVIKVEHDDEYADLIYVDIGGTTLISRITRVATAELQLANGSPVWVLIKSVSMRGHALLASRDAARPNAGAASATAASLFFALAPPLRFRGIAPSLSR